MTPHVLDPASEAARRIASLTWFLFIAGALVFIAVMLMLALAIRAGRGAESRSMSAGASRRMQLVAGGVVPAVIVVVVFVVTVRAIRAYTAPVTSADTDVELIRRSSLRHQRRVRTAARSARAGQSVAGRHARVGGFREASFTRTVDAHGSLVYTLLGFEGLVILAGLILMIVAQLWLWRRPEDPRGDAVTELAVPYWYFTAVSLVTVFGTIYLL